VNAHESTRIGQLVLFQLEQILFKQVQGNTRLSAHLMAPGDSSNCLRACWSWGSLLKPVGSLLKQAHRIPDLTLILGRARESDQGLGSHRQVSDSPSQSFGGLKSTTRLGVIPDVQRLPTILQPEDDLWFHARWDACREFADAHAKLFRE
jgi:hypothetical protein